MSSLDGRADGAARHLADRPAPLGIPSDLWDILACPCEAHGPVRADGESGRIVCTVCGRSFEVRDGIPVMLLDEATDPTGTED